MQYLLGFQSKHMTLKGNQEGHSIWFSNLFFFPRPLSFFLPFLFLFFFFFKESTHLPDFGILIICFEADENFLSSAANTSIVITILYLFLFTNHINFFLILFLTIF